MANDSGTFSAGIVADAYSEGFKTGLAMNPKKNEGPDDFRARFSALLRTCQENRLDRYRFMIPRMIKNYPREVYTPSLEPYENVCVVDVQVLKHLFLHLKGNEK